MAGGVIVQWDAPFSPCYRFEVNNGDVILHIGDDAVSLRLSDIIDNKTIVVNSNGKLAVQNRIFVQQTPSSEWIINHNLGAKTDVQAFTMDDVVLYGTVMPISENVTKIIFNQEQPRIGYALY